MWTREIMVRKEKRIITDTKDIAQVLNGTKYSRVGLTENLWKTAFKFWGDNGLLWLKDLTGENQPVLQTKVT